MGLYEWRFRISLAGLQPLSSSPSPRQEPSFRHAPLPSGAAWLSSLTRTLTRTGQVCGRFYAVVRIRHASGGISPTT